MSVLSWLLLRGYKRPPPPPLARCYHQRAPALPPTQTHLARGRRGWRHEPRKAAAAGLVAYSSMFLLPYAVTLLPLRRVPSTVRVRRIADDIIRGIHLILPNSPSSDEDKPGPQTPDLSELDWEVIVVRDKRANAYCRPGGKIIVNTGFLECLATDAEIVTILAHEVGHAVARHCLELHEVAFVTILPHFTLASRIERGRGGSDRNHATCCRGFRSTRSARGLPEARRDQRKLGMERLRGVPSFGYDKISAFIQSKAMKDAVELYRRKSALGEAPTDVLLWWNS
ncbi:hypothetical protein BRADI_1g19060v3 [Brachypodium distachyon]|uniref:Peptidase M48 domain-containing protein n=1 Tax=Brachypodium distachyon TaxID=15368 RepID=I1GRK6_BRADI|nr:hypothetical protein BRADI_1g19060v3 [Brachypodium distachyon]